MMFGNRLKNFYQQFLSLKGDPSSLAWGMAMGVFIGVTPTIPLHTGLIVILGFLFKKNMTSAFLGSWLISNPLTIPFFYFGEYQIGRAILGLEGPEMVIREFSLRSIFQLGWEIALPLLVGGVVLALVFAVPAYFLTHRLITALRKSHAPEVHSTGRP